MDSDRLNRWLTLGANIGVLIGIILLVVELDQNRNMMLAQTRNELSRGVVELLSAPSTNVELAEAWARVRQGEPVTPAQAVMIETFSESVFRYWENVHYQYRQGLYDDVEFAKHLDTMVELITIDVAFRNWWCTRRALYSEPFIQNLDERLDGQLCY